MKIKINISIMLDLEAIITALGINNTKRIPIPEVRVWIEKLNNFKVEPY